MKMTASGDPADGLPDNRKNARRKALQLLEYKDRTVRELRNRLRETGFTEEETEDAVSYAASFGYVNDERYAENYILSTKDSKSIRLIRQELLRKGIDAELIENAMAEIAPEEEQTGLLIRTIRKKYPEGSELDIKKMRSLYGYLGRRGFSYEEISHGLSLLNIRTSREL